MKKNTIEEMLEVIQAYKDGKTIQCWSRQIGDPGAGEWKDISDPCFNFSMITYRVVPAPKKVPLTAADIPLDRPVWIKGTKSDKVIKMVTSVYPTGVAVADCGWAFSDLMEKNVTISFDGGKTWQPCWKEVTE